jgi:hypothetical protein
LTCPGVTSILCIIKEEESNGARKYRNLESWPSPQSGANKQHTYSLLASVMLSYVDVEEDGNKEAEEPRTDLGRHAYIILDTGQITVVSPFTADYNSMQAPFMDAIVQYDCAYNRQSYILVIQNAQHVPSMRNNLLPPFLLREAGMRVQDTAKNTRKQSYPG